jgi:hypothetical protein
LGSQRIQGFFSKKLRKIVQHIFIVVVLSCFLGSCISTAEIAAPYYAFYTDGNQASKEAESVLVRHGICEEKKCGGKIYFVGPLRQGFEIIVYGVNDKEILREFSRYIFKRFHDNPKIQHVIVRGYADPFCGNCFPWPKIPIFKIEQRR